ncbi:MAG: hypothetical protein ACKVHP_12350, partial [Verrucomicrobiales bacterium]
MIVHVFGGPGGDYMQNGVLIICGIIDDDSLPMAAVIPAEEPTLSAISTKDTLGERPIANDAIG